MVTSQFSAEYNMKDDGTITKVKYCSIEQKIVLSMVIIGIVFLVWFYLYALKVHPNHVSNSSDEHKWKTHTSLSVHSETQDESTQSTRLTDNPTPERITTGDIFPSVRYNKKLSNAEQSAYIISTKQKYHQLRQSNNRVFFSQR